MIVIICMFIYFSYFFCECVWFDISVGFQDFEYWIRGPMTGTAGTAHGQVFKAPDQSPAFPLQKQGQLRGDTTNTETLGKSRLSAMSFV